jgi:hypothetical protein
LPNGYLKSLDYTMNTPQEVRNNFNNQLKDIDTKIIQLNAELEKAKEYRSKLLGGIETLELLGYGEESEEQPTEQ